MSFSSPLVRSSKYQLVISLLFFSFLCNASCLAIQNLSPISAPNDRNGGFQCGIANPSSAMSKIVGGTVSNPNEYPWLAYLSLSFWSGDAATCTGSLIGSRWILTAAHCSLGAVNITITLGSHDISNYEPNKQRTFTVTSQKVTAHPNFYFGSVENDIALIELPTDVSFSDYIQPVCLPFSNENDYVNETVTLTGWGNYSANVNSGTSQVVRQVQVVVIPSSEEKPKCQIESSIDFSGDNIICTDGFDGRHYCYGDDGGPMNYFDPEIQAYTVIGVAWMGDPSINCQDSVVPNIYARVSNYLDWIYNNTNIIPLPKPTTTTSTTTKTTTGNPSGFNCKNKPNGVYANPASKCSRTFYMCSNGFSYEFICPNAETVFNPSTGDCDYPYNVLGCQV